MPYTITCIPGDGIGPEVIAGARRVLGATGVQIIWEDRLAGDAGQAKYGTPLPMETLDSIRRNRVCLKGPVGTPAGSGFRSVNVAIRDELGLFATVRPARSFRGVKSRYEDIDLVVVRENTEDLYAGIEHMVGEDAAESIKIITRRGSERIVTFAFEFALAHGRKKVTAVHKANIMKFTDGLFLEVARLVAKNYPNVEFEDRIVDNMSMQLVQRPERYDVLVCPNLYGDILSDLCAGLVGGLGLVPSVGFGEECAVFETVHGTSPQYAGMDKVNPAAAILASALMLRHLGETEAARRIDAAVAAVIEARQTVTYDLGGHATTAEMAEAIAQKIERNEV